MGIKYFCHKKETLPTQLVGIIKINALYCSLKVTTRQDILFSEPEQRVWQL